MSKLNATDIQGFVLRGYNLPLARYFFLHLTAPTPAQPPSPARDPARDLLNLLLPRITTGQRWDAGTKPQSTLNIAFTHPGLAALDLPDATLLSFPVEFQQGMRDRADILGDTGHNDPAHWDSVWQPDQPAVHAWVAVNAATPAALEAAAADLLADLEASGGATVVGHQDACAVLGTDGKPTTGEHFGFTDGFGNPDYLGVERKSQPGQGKLVPGKLTPEGKPTWAPLATGELLLGYADEAGELPVAPTPHILAANGTFMVLRKLHQNVAAFRAYLDEHAPRYAGGRNKLAAKFIGRWQDGTPLMLSPDAPNAAITQDPAQSTAFTYAADPEGRKCPMAAHIRRVHPRDTFGFEGRLVHRRRITRRGLPYGRVIPPDRPTQPADDTEDRGVIFMALNASIQRQFEFVQQQWIGYGNDARQGNDQDALLGNHDGCGRFVIQGDTTPTNPPFVCSHLPNFVELRGGAYFFLPSITALGMISMNLVDPR